MRRLPRRDLVATLFVLAGVIVYVLWMRDAAFAGVSIRVVAAVVFGLGFAGCVANTDGLMQVFGARPDEPRASMSYIVVLSALGGAALVFGILAMVGGQESMLIALVCATAGLWALATTRHVLSTAHERPRAHPAAA